MTAASTTRGPHQVAVPPVANLLGYDRTSLESYLDTLGERSFRAGQLIKWIHARGVLDFDAMTDIGRSLRGRLAEQTCLALPQIAAARHSRDGVRKWLFRLGDDNVVETVYIPAPRRDTLCVSSQVGCPLACGFCATGARGFNRNLDAGEIVGQLWRASRILEEAKYRISNVVFMGMGEPLLNCDHVLAAVNLMLDSSAYNLSRRRVTVSTAGVVPGIARLARESRASLAVSLHAANDALRDQLVPLNRSYSLTELLSACRAYCRERNGDPVTFEYTLLAGVNDTPEQARRLLSLLVDLPYKLNLIPFNPYRGTAYKPSTAESTRRFQSILAAGGAPVTLRKTRGADVDAACGQLVGAFQARASRYA